MQLRSALDDGLFEIPDQDLAHGSDFFSAPSIPSLAHSYLTHLYRGHA